jgi:Dodecin
MEPAGHHHVDNFKSTDEHAQGYRGARGIQHELGRCGQNAVKQATKTLEGVKSIYIEHFEASVGHDGEIADHRINAKITFLLK